MNRPRRNRYRAAAALTLAVAMGLLAAVGALAGIAVAKDGHHRSDKRHGQQGRHHHGQPSGTIQSFDTATGRLTIALLNEETVSGLVTDRTRIRCEDEHSPDITASRTHLRHGEEEPGDDNGHGAEAGDDNGGHGEEPGDDNGGGDNSGPGNSNSVGSGPSGHDDNGAGANCTTSDLIVGATVTKADLEIEDGSATFDEVELAG
jgi:hypothetical protein